MKISAAILFIALAMSCHQSDEKKESNLHANKQVVFEIGGMVCDFGCPKLIKSSLLGTTGIVGCEVNYPDSLVTIDFDSTVINTEKIIKIFPSIGEGTYHIKNTKSVNALDVLDKSIIITTPKSEEEREKEKLKDEVSV